MLRLLVILLSVAPIGTFCRQSAATFPSHPKHFVFFGGDRQAIHDSAFYLHPGISGAQVIYQWRKLEKEKDQYDFSAIREDVAFLASKGKKLFIQLQDVTFDSTFTNVPRYILTDTIYHGGADPDYTTTAAGMVIKSGWVSRRWDTAVAARWHKLIRLLGKEFNGQVEGINLPESSVTFGEGGTPLPFGFTYENYREALKENMRVLKQSFPDVVTIQYANFMPGGKYLSDLYDYAREIKIGMGGPDIEVYKKFQMNNSYPLIQGLRGWAPTGVAVQHGNYSVINPKTGKQVTVPEILDFAVNYLGLDYIFWCTEEPWYSQQVLPLLRSLIR